MVTTGVITDTVSEMVLVGTVREMVCVVGLATIVPQGAVTWEFFS